MRKCVLGVGVALVLSVTGCAMRMSLTPLAPTGAQAPSVSISTR